jgi:hypothetical protein
MSWLYEGKQFDPDYEFLEDWVGFVYVITEKNTGMKYVGKKFFHKKKTLPITKTRKRRKHTRVESDWKTYFGSSVKVQELKEEYGADAFEREIIRLCKTKGDCAYYETKEQFDREVLIKDDYYNGIINCRINRSHLSQNKKK